MGDAERSPEALISLPRGGGAIRGMGETFSPDLQTGTGNLTVPIVVPEGRGALDPKLALSYSSGAGNGQPDDRVHRCAEPHIREDLDEIGSSDRCTVDEVLTLRAAHEAPRDRHLREVEIRPTAVLVVEEELDLAVLSLLAIAAAGEEDVVGLLGAELGRRQ